MRKASVKNELSRIGFSVPRWMAPLIRKRARAHDQTLSQYIRALVRSDLEKGSSLVRE